MGSESDFDVMLSVKSVYVTLSNIRYVVGPLCMILCVITFQCYHESWIRFTFGVLAYLQCIRYNVEIYIVEPETVLLPLPSKPLIRSYNFLYLILIMIKKN